MSLPAASTRARSAILSRLRAAAPVELPAPDVAAYYADAYRVFCDGKRGTLLIA